MAKLQQKYYMECYPILLLGYFTTLSVAILSMIGRQGDFEGSLRRLTQVPTQYLSGDADIYHETPESGQPGDPTVIQIQHLLNT
jgi:hypothetical protein